MNIKNQSARTNTFNSSRTPTHAFEATQQQYLDLIDTSNEIVTGSYEATDQERQDLAHWALALYKRDELYPTQKSNALVHAGAVFDDRGFRRYAQGLNADALEHTGENLKWLHDATAETWHKIDSGLEVASIAAVSLASQLKIEENHGHYQDASYEHMMKVMYEEKRRQQKADEALEKAAAIARSTTYDADSAAYNPFADEHGDDLVKTT